MKSSSSLLDGSSSHNPQAWLPQDLSQVSRSPGESPPPKSVKPAPSDLPPGLRSPGDKDALAIGSPAGSAAGSAAGRSADAWLPPEIGSVVVGGVHPVDRAWRPAFSPSAARSSSNAVLQARDEAQRLIAEAEAKAKQIVDAARQRADELTLQAHKEGWTAAEEETQYMLQTAKNIVQQIMNWREELFSQSESAVIDLVKEMAVRMFGEGVQLGSETLQQNYNHVLENARSMGDITIYMNPEDALALGPYWREYQVSISGREVQIIPSESIRRGGCFVDGKWGSVDARIETQLKSIMDTLSQTPDQML